MNLELDDANVTFNSEAIRGEYYNFSYYNEFYTKKLVERCWHPHSISTKACPKLDIYAQLDETTKYTVQVRKSNTMVS